MSDSKAIGPEELPVDIHPAANLFPMMDEQSYPELKADIDQNGIQVWMTFLDGKLIDGRNRYRACVELGIDPDHYSDELDADLVPDPIDWVLSVNLHRRHLTTSQRSMIAAKVATLKRGDNQHTKEDGQKCPPSTGEAAKQLHVGDRTVKQAKSVIREGCQSLVDAVSAGTVPVSLADKLTRKVSDHDQQERLVREGVEAIRKAVADPPPDPKVQAFDLIGVARSKIADCSELFGDDRAETLRGILLDEAALIEQRLAEGGSAPESKTAPQDFTDGEYEDVPDDVATPAPDESPLTALRPVIFGLDPTQLLVVRQWLHEILKGEQ